MEVWSCTIPSLFGTFEAKVACFLNNNHHKIKAVFKIMSRGFLDTYVNVGCRMPLEGIYFDEGVDD